MFHNAIIMTIMYYNARSLIPKYDKLCVTMEAQNPDMICTVETAM